MRRKYNLDLNVIDGRECKFHDGRVLYTSVEAFGNDLQDCLANATVGRVDWHGNDFEAVSVGELSSELYELVERAITEAIYGQ